MYAITDCPTGQPQADRTAVHAAPRAVLVHLQEHRSHLSQDARVTFTVLIAVFMAMAILPALRGQWLVSAFAIGTMALLVGVLDWRRRTRPAAEWLALDQGWLLWRSLSNDTVEHRARRIKIATCLGLEERRAAADLITREFAAARRRAAPLSL